MIRIEKYSMEMKDIWDKFVDSAKNPLFMHKRDYMDYHKDRFEDNSLLFYNDEKLVALLPISKQGSELISHGGLTYGGFILDYSTKQHTVNECASELVDYLRRNGYSKMVYKCIPHIYHLQPSEEDKYALFHSGFTLKEVAASTVVDLNKPCKMPKGRKAQISRAKRDGVAIEKLSSKEEYENFILLENSVLKSRHDTVAVHTADELYMLHERFPENILLYGALLDGKMIAGTVVFVYDTVVHTQYMAADDVAREIGALDLVIKTVMDEFSGSKRWLDFGISTENHGKYLNQGLISQKEGFGGRTDVYECYEYSNINNDL